MGGISSLAIAGSGMWAAQAGLSVVGHNLANVNTVGYSRQSTIQSDWGYLNVSGGQIGYGTNVSSVRQIRNEFLDVKYRNEVTKATYYSTKVQAGQQIESLLGELQSEYTTESVISDLWNSLNELSTDPSSLETRGNFVSTAITLVDKMKVVYEGLEDYQLALNDSVKQQVNDLNYYVSEIDKLNGMIKSAEVNGANANDYRDARNTCMDYLSEIADCDFKYKKDGTVDIFLEGNPLLSNGLQFNVGLKYTAPGSSFVEPCFTDSKKILKWDDNVVPLYKLTDSIKTENGDDGGALKATLVARGIAPVDYTTLENLVPSSDFLKMGAPDPADYRPLGSNDPAYQAAAAAFAADETAFLNNLRSALDFLPEAPIAPDSADAAKYPLGTADPAYVKDLASYYKDVEEFNEDRVYDAPVFPDAADLTKYPLGAADPAFAADVAQYQTDITTYNADMISLTVPTPPAAGASAAEVAEYNLQLAQYQIDNNKFQNYLTKYKEYAQNDVDYDFNYDRMYFNCTESTIPVFMQNIDQLFHDIVTMINDAVAPMDHNPETSPAGVDEENTQFLEIFKRTDGGYDSRYDANGVYQIEDPNNKNSLYSISNTEINPELLNTSGYNKIGFSSLGNPSDNTVINGILDDWANPSCQLPAAKGEENEELSINEAYNLMVTLNANDTAEDISFLEAQIVMVNSVQNDRLAVMGVSLDEEMAQMQIYQTAYQASARIYSVVNDMLDRLINGTGRVGL